MAVRFGPRHPAGEPDSGKLGHRFRRHAGLAGDHDPADYQLRRAGRRGGGRHRRGCGGRAAVSARAAACSDHGHGGGNGGRHLSGQKEGKKLSAVDTWLAIVVLTVATILTRSSLFLLGHAVKLPSKVQHALRYAPAAAMAAIVAPDLVLTDGVLQLTWMNPKLVA